MFPIRMASPHVTSSGPSDDRCRQALHVLDTGLAMADPHGLWLEFNPAFERLLGGHAGLRCGSAVDACIADADREHFAQDLADCARSGQRGDAVRRWMQGDGRVLRMRTRLAPMADAMGVVQAVLVQLDPPDDTAGDTVQRPLQLFADKVAHDLRAPLRSIESFSTLLARRAAPRLDDTDRDHLERIRAAAERMGGLLAALGEYSRAMQAELRSAPVDLSLLAEWIAAELQEAEPARAAEFHVQPGLAAWGDERLLKLMLGQLLGNAWKFSRHCERVAIDVAGERDGDRLRVRVRDRGCGFDMQYSHKLFEPFQRLHGPEHGGGHGLGLAIAHCIAQRHGGGIEAHSQPDAGSVFTIELPAAAMAQAATLQANRVSDAQGNPAG
jgi:PAS domain S-box-containing protein